MAALDSINVVQRPSGTLICGLGGDPFYLRYLGEALRLRFPELSEPQRDIAAHLVRVELRGQRSFDAPRPPPEQRWVDSWKAPPVAINWP